MSAEVEDHYRSVCCPDDSTCPWPDACNECGQDWPCATIRAARRDERARLQSDGSSAAS